jgi:hypothetical protein
MAHQDQGRCGAGRTCADDLFRALRWITANVKWSEIRFRKDATWTARTLVWAAVLWAWSDEKTLGHRFAAARKITRRGFPKQDEPATSYQAFTKLLRRWTPTLLALLIQAFRVRMQQSLGRVWTVAGWFVLACDGSGINVPRTRANEGRYSPKSKLAREAQNRRRKRRRKKLLRQKQARERKANVPILWLTMLWHVGSGLPWNWRLGPSDSSERGHLIEMLAGLPLRTLIVADAGFVGYELWKAVLDAACHLLVRVGANVRLLRKLGYVEERGGLVYLWPNRAAKKNLPPLVLRLIVVHDGRRPIYLVTSVMDEAKLSDAAAARIYRHRWGIELFYRHCKQTFERGKLRSHNPDNVLIEMHWSLLGMWALGLHSHHHLLQRGVSPERISFAGVLRAYRHSMREYKSPPDPGDSLTQRLNRSLIDDYVRKNKTSRDYPRKKHEQAAGRPIIHIASRAQIKLAKRLKNAETKKRLTA